MNNHEGSVSGAIACSLKLLILLTACVLFLVPAAHADENQNLVVGDWEWMQTGEPVHLPYTVAPLPPSEGFQVQERSSTCPGPCPVNGEKGTPRLRDQGLSGSKATCRGACGADCPPDRCKDLPAVTIPYAEGTCTYSHVIECYAAQACIDHDACYDDCSENPIYANFTWYGLPYIWKHIHDPCQVRCDRNCFAEYGTGTCLKYADFPGKVTTFLGKFVDSLFPPLYDLPLTFSDCPVYKETETPPPDTLLPPEWILPNMTSGPTPPPLQIPVGKWVGTWKFSGVSTGGCTYNHAGKLEWIISSASGGTFSGTTNVDGIDLRWGVSENPQKKCTHDSYTKASGTVTGTVTGNALKGSFTHTVSRTGETQKFGWTATLDGDMITGTIPAPKSGGSGGSFSLKLT